MSHQKKDFEGLLTLEELSQWLKVEQSTIHKWIAKDQIPSFKVGKYRRFDADEIRRWLKRRSSAA